MAENGIIIRRATEADLLEMAEIGIENFSGHGGRIETAQSWIETWQKASPMYHVFVAVRGERIIGYIDWRYEGGFGRQHPVAELDQVGLRRGEPKGQGLGKQLIRESLDTMRRWTKENLHQATLLRIVVWFYANNTGAHGAYAEFFPEPAGFRIQYSEAEMMRRGIISILDPESPIDPV